MEYRNPWREVPSKILIGLSICSFLVLGVLTVLLFWNNILPMRYRLTLVGVLFAASIGLYLFGFHHTIRIWPKVLGIIAAIFLLLLSTVAILYVITGINTLSAMERKDTGEASQVISMSVVVRRDSEYQELSQINGKDVWAPLSFDAKNINDTVALLAKEGLTIQTQTTPSYLSAAEQLLAGNGDIMLMNEAYRKPIMEAHPEFASETRTLPIKGMDIVQERPEPISTEVTEASFNIYISGIDTFGELQQTSRSDVNIIASVNPDTKNILLTSVSRDAYVPIAGGGKGEMDKLTHAGIYGIGSSVRTLENLLDTSINYYVRLNFTSFMNIIDQIGGVTVDNPVTFTSIDGIRFHEGKIELNGKEALAYVRERKHLSDGDRDRAKNQERVIEAVFDKLIGPHFLLNFQSIMATIQDSIETNMPKGDIMKLVNQQLDNGSAWTFTQNNIKGEDSMGLPSYAMPDSNLYMYVLDKDSVQEAIDKIENTLQGK